MRICYGGTFDPIHDAHIATAKAANRCFDSDVFFIPSADPPHRNRPQASATQRAEMIGLAIKDEQHFHLDRRELDRHGPSYTIDTLREIRQQIGHQAPLAWLIGADAFADIHTWHEWQSLFDLAHFIVAVRPGYDWHRAREAVLGRVTEQAEHLHLVPAGRVFPLDCPPRSESASAIRRALGRGERAMGLNAKVQAYISQYQLYRQGL
jgi:nicotinate-nucleotide adenylyltransferase